MKPISVPLPSGETSCYPTTTENVIQCYSNNNTIRSTYRLCLEATNSNNYWCRTSQDYYNYGSYSPTGIPIDSNGYRILPELSNFWFPLISCICVGFIFYFIYRILFRRFIK